MTADADYSGAMGAIDEYLREKQAILEVVSRKDRSKGSTHVSFELPSKASLIAAAKGLGYDVTTATYWIGFGWEVQTGKLSIRFHCWPELQLPMLEWFKSRVALGVVPAMSSKSLDLWLTELPTINLALSVNSQYHAINDCLGAAIRMQVWFERLAPEFECWLGEASGKGRK